ncbi:MAG: Asp/Glu racemase [Ilumatobacteraceae bacterium]|nr:Asp/Glu racemase [Ilumatobacteraceae bacterium]
MITIEHIPYAADDGLAPSGRIGLVMLASDHTIEAEMHALVDRVPGLGLFGNRIRNEDQITPDTLRAMAPRITTTVDDILPGAHLDVVAFACTSATMAIGEVEVFARIRASRPGARCTTPITGALAAFAALGARRVGVLTPYRADVNEIVAGYLRERDVDVPVFGTFNEESDAAVATISPASIRDGVHRLVAAVDDLDAVFVSCTSVRLVDHVEALEAELGIPVTSSNLAMAWHAIRLAGVTAPLAGLGRLFEH